jgi:hypothetical protein
MVDDRRKARQFPLGGHQQIEFRGRWAELVEETPGFLIVKAIFPSEFSDAVGATAKHLAVRRLMCAFRHAFNLLFGSSFVPSAFSEVEKGFALAKRL